MGSMKYNGLQKIKVHLFAPLEYLTDVILIRQFVKLMVGFDGIV